MKKQLQQPAALETIATNRIVTWIMWNIKIHLDRMNRIPDTDANKTEDMFREIEIFRNYFQNVPGVILNNVLAGSMAQISTMPHWASFNSLLESIAHVILNRLHATSRWIEVFFTPNITNLSIDLDIFQIFKTSFTTKANLLTGLTSLEININEVYDISDSEPIVCYEYAEFFKRIPNLKYLKISCASKNVLRCILDNCKSIVKLELHKYSTTDIEVFDVIHQLPNIENVYLFDSSRDVIFQPIRVEAKRKSILQFMSTRSEFEIKSFVITNETRMEDILLLKRYPNIERLEFVNTKYEHIHRLEYLNTEYEEDKLIYMDVFFHLHDLRQLKILSYTFYEGRVKNFIEAFGGKLQILCLSACGSLDLEALKCIGLMCPYLKKLIISADAFSTEVIPSKTKSCPWSREDNILFKNLRSLEMSLKYGNVSENQSSQAPGQFALFLLENCPNIEYISLGTINLTNDFLLNVLDKNPLRYLKVLRMPRKLDQIVIDRIKESNITPNIEFVLEYLVD